MNIAYNYMLDEDLLTMKKYIHSKGGEIKRNDKNVREYGE